MGKLSTAFADQAWLRCLLRQIWAPETLPQGLELREYYAAACGHCQAVHFSMCVVGLGGVGTSMEGRAEVLYGARDLSPPGGSARK